MPPICCLTAIKVIKSVSAKFVKPSNGYLHLHFSKNLKRIADKYGVRIQVINIVNPPDSQQSVREYMASMGSYASKQLFLFDSGQVTASYLKITPENPGFDTPYFFVIDQMGWIQDDYSYNVLNDSIFRGEGLDEIINRYLPN